MDKDKNKSDFKNTSTYTQSSRVYTVHDTYLTYVCNVGGQRMCTNTRMDGLVSICYSLWYGDIEREKQ
jgi:hypothetical protein